MMVRLKLNRYIITYLRVTVAIFCRNIFYTPGSKLHHVKSVSNDKVDVLTVCMAIKATGFTDCKVSISVRVGYILNTYASCHLLDRSVRLWNLFHTDSPLTRGIVTPHAFYIRFISVVSKYVRKIIACNNRL